MSARRAARMGLVLCAIGIVGLLATRVLLVVWLGRAVDRAPLVAARPSVVRRPRPGSSL